MYPATNHRRRFLLTVLSLAAVFAASPAAGAIYRCVSGDEPPRFSQFPCGDGRTVVLEPLHTVSIPPVSDAEQAILDELERQREARWREQAVRRSSVAEQARRARAAQHARCQAARAGLDVLAAERRKGYRASEVRSLDRREAALEAEARGNC